MTNKITQFSQKQLDTFEVCSDIDKCLHRLEFDHKFAVVTSRYHIRSMPLQLNIFCFDESQNIHNYLNTFMIRNNFAMKSEFNNMIKRIVTSGLLTKWQKDLRLYYVSKEVYSSGESLSLTDFSYAFFFAIPFLSLSMLIYMSEFLIYCKANSVNATKYWKFWDKLISGKRYWFLVQPKNDDVFIPFTN